MTHSGPRAFSITSMGITPSPGELIDGGFDDSAQQMSQVHELV
jgi:hypothetical protein